MNRILLTLLYQSGWTTKPGSSWIDYDIQEVPLQIQTDSTLGSGEMMWVRFKGGNVEFGMEVKFSNPPTYDIGYCTPSDADPTFALPGPGEVQIWTITKYSTKLTLHCNGVKIFNYQFSDSDRPDCLNKWSTETTAFQIHSTDTASNFYRAAPNYGNLSLIKFNNNFNSASVSSQVIT